MFFNFIKIKDKAANAWDKTKDATGEAYDTAKDKTKSTWEATKDTFSSGAEEGREKAQEHLGDAKDATNRAGDKIKSGYEDVKQSAEDGGRFSTASKKKKNN